jgi:serine O-acetyltransferase
VIVGAGAKILGPILVGDGAKVGSNAVVVRDVPPGATAVGIPARVTTAAQQERREETAAKMKFSAYGIGADVNDPVVQAIHQLLDHAAVTEERFNRLVVLLQRGGVDCAEAKAIADAFDPQQINKMLE